MVFNRSDKIIILVGLIIIVLFGLFPPWAYFDPSTGNFVQTCESSGNLFFEQPEPSAKINYQQLIYNWVVIIVLTSTVLLAKKFICSKNMKQETTKGIQCNKNEKIRNE